MKIAFSYWEKRVAPVFDTNQEILVIETESRRVVCRSVEAMTEEVSVLRAQHLLTLGINTLVCGAISRPLHSLIVAYGIKVIPFVAGDLDEVVQAWLDNQLDIETYNMPGCWRRRGSRRQFSAESGEQRMKGQGRGQGGGTVGKGGGQNQRAGREGRRAIEGSGIGAVGNCLCPNCGHIEGHERGVPCGQKSCPECGTPMTRQ